MEVALVVGVAIIAIAVVTTLARRLGVAGPLLLVAVGLAVALLPFVEIPLIQPEWILAGVLPPLLYSAAVQLPAIEFRRDFGPIAGLSILLVVISALVLGVFFWAVIPEVGLPLGIALGAILSPTDAVATAIAKRLGIAPRVITMLEGESLLNDATALVLLRTAIAAIAGSFSFWGAAGTFVWGVVIAVVLGAVIGYLALRLRGWVGNSAANTAISYTVPFIAYFPTEHLGGSGLVAAVVAGIVTGQGARRWFSPEERLSDDLNWRTIELVLEGGVFLIMGLELRDIVTRNLEDHGGLWHGVWLAAAALGIALAVRAGYVALLVWLQTRRARDQERERLESFNDRIDDIAADPEAFTAAAARAAEGSRGLGRAARSRRGRGLGRNPSQRIDSMRARVSRALADLDYYQATPIGWKHGTVIVWAGMRGVVTLAAAQTLPRDDSISDSIRALLVFVAFLVALGSLMLQGLTLPTLVRLLRFETTDDDATRAEEQKSVDRELRYAAASALTESTLSRPDGTPFTEGFVERVGNRYTRPPDDDASAIAREALELRLVLIQVMRRRLDQLSRGGSYSTASLRHALAELDAEQLSLELRLDD